MEDMETIPFELTSGRTIGVTEFGNRDSTNVVVFAHSAPGSSLFDPDPRVTADHDVRVIAIDRPGYGASEIISFETPTVHRAAADIAEYLADQGISSVAVAGWSAGGRIALALAAANPNLVSRVAVIATPAPDDEVPWVGADNRAMVEQYRGMIPHEATLALAAMFDEFQGAEPSAERMLDELATPEMDAVLQAAAHDRLIAMLQASARQGNIGVAADIISYTVLPLGFDLADVHAETLLVYGGGDSVVGVAHATWYDRHLMNATVSITPVIGHLVVIPAWKQVLDFLVPVSAPTE